jgi:nucleoside-diphosphate-sugar epimerase
MRILVTGGFGNVGSHTLPELRCRGHEVRCLSLPSLRARRLARRLGVPTVWGDVSDPELTAAAVSGVDVVIHLAAVIPPRSDAVPTLARKTNVDGTAAVVAACRAQPTPPRLLFTSTFDVHGHTLRQTPPRHVDDPLVATDPYTEHKIECERLVRGSGLTWAIFRLVDVPVLGLRAPHPIMYEIGLDNRIEVIHADDVGLAIANALATPPVRREGASQRGTSEERTGPNLTNSVWGRVLFIGGGPSCQLTYREYLTRLLAAMGVDPLPEAAFSTAEYATDWVDTVDGNALLAYQRHTFDDIVGALRREVGWRRGLARLARPLVRAGLLRLSAHYRR